MIGRDQKDYLSSHVPRFLDLFFALFFTPCLVMLTNVSKTGIIEKKKRKISEQIRAVDQKQRQKATRSSTENWYKHDYFERYP